MKKRIDSLPSLITSFLKTANIDPKLAYTAKMKNENAATAFCASTADKV